VNPERGDLHDEQEDFHADDEYDDYAPRSIFATGWFRAVLVLAVLAVVVVVALPHLLNWFAPVTPPATEPARVTQGAPSASAPASAPASQPAQSAVPAPSDRAPQKADVPTMPALSASAPHGASISPKPSQAPARTQTARSRERGAAISGKSSGTPPEAQGTYWVQLGSFKDATNAERLARKVKEQGFSVQVASVTRSEGIAAADGIAAGTYHLVRAGAFPDRQRAAAARDSLGARGYSGFLTQGPAK
jgi:cell division septation protein DedD